MAIEDCENLRAAIERFSVEYEQLDADVTVTQKELAALTAAQASPDVIGPVQDRLTEQLAELNMVAGRGRASSADFQVECGGQKLPKPPWGPEGPDRND